MSLEKRDEWNESYIKGDNYLFYPHEEIIKFVNKYVIKRVGIGEFAPIMKSRRMLDLGCGIGRHVIYGLENKIDAIGIDLSDKAIQAAKKWADSMSGVDSDKRFFSGDVRALPFDNSEFDFVVSHGVLDSMPFDIAKKAVQEVHRVSKANSLFYCDLICDVSGDSNIEEVVQGNHEKGTIQSYFTKEKVLNLISGYFSIRESVCINRIDENNQSMNARYHIVLSRL